VTHSFASDQDAALARYLDHIWTCVEAGAGPGRSPFTLVQAATTGRDGAPQLRTVVLRQAHRAQNAVWFHADARSPKVAELHADPRISLLAYDPQSQLQIRMAGHATISDDEAERRRMWTTSRAHTLVLYQSPLTPSTSVASPEEAYPSDSSHVTADTNASDMHPEVKTTHDEATDGKAKIAAKTTAKAPTDTDVTPAITDPGYPHFSLIRVVIQRFDALHITSEGHKRALFTRDKSTWKANWLVP